MEFMTVILHRHACVSHLHVVYRAVILFCIMAAQSGVLMTAGEMALSKLFMGCC